ncbi:NAD(P)-dependent oxidoreductase [Gluconacetobacter asukensis]|uniref:Gfo/Idh/MocA family oxidoreductase n=1 Tax=Gluconacetobacter asukensis TaxID=1017181 RepID=A0A7W4J263_9PROT|nr:NAD(P)-dependent oxidoreductase [Gluconacetobacter asukensis]MBB2173108.1 Gfo/Idh/MocA family oxidoreductase [Gluconacetobacter asukensis]
MTRAAPIRALVVGAGVTSCLLHLPRLAQLRDAGRLALVEICDVMEERAVAARQKFGFSRCSGDALSGFERADVDAVYLFGDARMHYTLGMAALERGKHLFAEKPIAPNYAAACRLAEMAQARGLVACGGHNRRFYRSMGEVRRLGGKAGWHSLEAVFHKPSHAVAPPFGASSWLTANGIHALDALLFINGSLPDHIATSVRPNAYAALLQWPDGARGSFLCDNNAGERREAYAFHAAGLTCRIDEEALHVARAGQTHTTPMPGLDDGFAAEHAAFLDAIAQRTEPPHGIAALAPSLRLAELIEAGFSGKVDWPETSPVRPVAAPRWFDKSPSDDCSPEDGPVGDGLSGAGSMLVVNARGLSLGRVTTSIDRPIVAIEDVLRSARPRPDIVAALIGTGPRVITDALLDLMPNLRVAGLVGLSFARHNPEALLARDVALVNASRTYAENVAEFVLGLAILGRRRGFASHQLMRNGGWGSAVQPDGWRGSALKAARAVRPVAARMGLEPLLRRGWRQARPLHGIAPAASTPTRALHGATTGLIGWGENARALAVRLVAAGAKVLVFSEHAPVGDIRAVGATPAALGEALAADIVSLHRGLTPATRHFLGSAELARLRPGAVLINVARAELIEPGALLARLKAGDIFACIDVFDREPPPARDPLRRLPNVFLTSHIAGSAEELRAGALAEVLHKMERHLGGAPVRLVTPTRLRTMT